MARCPAGCKIIEPPSCSNRCAILANYEVRTTRVPLVHRAAKLLDDPVDDPQQESPPIHTTPPIKGRNSIFTTVLHEARAILYNSEEEHFISLDTVVGHIGNAVLLCSSINMPRGFFPRTSNLRSVLEVDSQSQMN